MSLTITIGGTDVTGLVTRNTFSLPNALGQRDTLSLSLCSPDASYRPVAGAEISVTHSELGAQFGGTVRNVRADLQGATSVVSRIACASWDQIFDRRRCGQRTWTSQSAGAIFQEIFTDWMGGEDLTATIVADGPVIPEFSVDFCSVREGYDKLCELASIDSDTYMWDTTPEGVTRLFQQTSFAAPIDVTEDRSDILRPISVTWSFDQYGNKVFVRVGNYIQPAQTQTFLPDGSTRSFSVDKPIASTPTIVLDGVTQTVGLRNSTGTPSYTYTYTLQSDPDFVHSITIAGTLYSFAENGYGQDQLAAVIAGLAIADPNCTVTVSDADSGAVAIAAKGGAVTVSESDGNTTVTLESATKQWYWQQNSPTVEQDEAETIPGSSSTLEVTFQGYGSTVIDGGQNDDAVSERQAAEGGTGWYAVLLETNTGNTSADAQTLAAAWLSRYSAIPETVEYSTTYGGIRAGMHQQITLNKFGPTIDATFLIESSTLVNENADWLWKVKAVNGALGGGWMAKLRSLTQGSGSAGGIAVSGSSAGGGSSDDGSVTINGAPVTY